MRTTTTIALSIVATLALGACSKKSSGGLRARAEVAKATNDPKKGEQVYNEADQKIDESIEKLHGLGYKSINRGILGAISTKVIFGSVKPEDRNEVKRLLNKIVTDADTQIGLAKKFEDVGSRERAERIKANAQIALDQVSKEEQQDKK